MSDHPALIPPDAVCLPLATAFGPMHAALTPRGLAGLWFEGQKHSPNLHFYMENPEKSPRILSRQLSNSEHMLSQYLEQFSLGEVPQ